MAKKLMEQHLTDAKAFTLASKSGLIQRPKFEEPPRWPAVPSYEWLLHIYAMDVMSRIEDVKAAITSTFGEVLKMDST
jgi:hypothetical protein